MENNSARGRRSRNKGKRGEQEFVNFIKQLGLIAKRNLQFQKDHGAPDVYIEGVPLSIEVKRNEKINVCKELEEHESKSKEGTIPILVFRKNRGEWIVAIKAEKFFKEMLLAHRPLFYITKDHVGLAD